MDSSNAIPTENSKLKHDQYEGPLFNSDYWNLTSEILKL